MGTSSKNVSQQTVHVVARTESTVSYKKPIGKYDNFLLPAKFGTEERIRNLEMLIVAMLLTVALQCLMVYSVAAIRTKERTSPRV